MMSRNRASDFLALPYPLTLPSSPLTPLIYPCPRSLPYSSAFSSHPSLSSPLTSHLSLIPLITKTTDLLDLCFAYISGIHVFNQ